MSAGGSDPGICPDGDPGEPSSYAIKMARATAARHAARAAEAAATAALVAAAAAAPTTPTGRALRRGRPRHPATRRTLDFRVGGFEAGRATPPPGAHWIFG
jgi:hypothetical protein